MKRTHRLMRMGCRRMRRVRMRVVMVKMRQREEKGASVMRVRMSRSHVLGLSRVGVTC